MHRQRYRRNKCPWTPLNTTKNAKRRMTNDWISCLSTPSKCFSFKSVWPWRAFTPSWATPKTTTKGRSPWIPIMISIAWLTAIRAVTWPVEHSVMPWIVSTFFSVYSKWNKPIGKRSWRRTRPVWPVCSNCWSAPWSHRRRATARRIKTMSECRSFVNCVPWRIFSIWSIAHASASPWNYSCNYSRKKHTR